MPTNNGPGYFRKTFASLKTRNYRLYFIGQAVSLCGTWMQTIGQDWLVLKLTNSGTQLGIVSAFQFLPVLLLGPWGGGIADRFNKRKVMYWTQGLAGILALILGVLVAGNEIKIWMVYVLALCLGLVNTINNPTQQTFVFEMVGQDQLQNAVALNSTLVNLARAAGPAIAGILIATLGLGACFLINAVSYIAVLIALFMMRSSELHSAGGRRRAGGGLGLREGFAYVLATPVLKYTLLMMAIIGTLSYEFSVILPLVAQFTFHGGAGTYAALVAATGAGSAAGGLYIAGRKREDARLLVGSAAGFGAFMIIASLMPNVVWGFVAMLLVGIFSINFIALGNTTLQLESHPDMRGRVMSLWTMAFLGSTPIGGPIIGYIGEHFSPRWGLATGGLAALAAALIGSWTLVEYAQRRLATAEASVEIDESSSEDASAPK